jgi:hypothetical protein
MNWSRQLKLDGMSVALLTVDALPKLIFVDKRHDLRKDCFFLYSWLAKRGLMPIRKTMISNRKIFLAL